MDRWIGYLVVGVLVFLPARGVPAQTGVQEGVVARAGGRFISEREFTERFELLPALYRHRASRLEEAKLELLYSLTAEKLLAQEAIDRGLDRDSSFLAALHEIRKLLARDQLYREEVTANVAVTAEELARERERAERLVHLAFVYFERKQDAEVVARTITSASDFDRLSVDSSVVHLRDTATVIWGDADPEIEDAAYALAPGAVSVVVAAGSGYYILRQIGERRTGIAAQENPEAFRARLETRIRARNETRRMHEVLAAVTAGGNAYARPAPFRTLAAALMTAMRAESTMTTDSVLTLNTRVVAAARAECGDVLTDSLAVAGNTRWTVAEVLDRLRSRRLRIQRDRISDVPALLNGELEYWTQQELLADEALRRGLDRRPDVEERLALWREAYLAMMMKHLAESRVGVTEADILEEMASADSAVHLPEVNLRILRTASLDAMQSALEDLERGEEFADVVRRWTTDVATRETGGLTGFLPVRARDPVASLAAGLEPGDRYGPVSAPGGFLLLEVEETREGGALPDSVRIRRREEAREAVFARKRQGLLNRFLAQAASRRGVDVYHDRLRRIQVTPVPMLTFRILGFGGRMFEVPFVDPQIQWLNIAPEEAPVLP